MLLDEPHTVKDRRVLELGCGLGTAGIAAALAGAKDIVTQLSGVAVSMCMCELLHASSGAPCVGMCTPICLDACAMK